MTLLALLKHNLGLLLYQVWWWGGVESSRHSYSHVLYFFAKQIRFLCNHCWTRRNSLWRDVRGGWPAWWWCFLQQFSFAESLMCMSWCPDMTQLTCVFFFLLGVTACLQANTALLLAHVLWGVGLCLFQLVSKSGTQSSMRKKLLTQLRSSAVIMGPRCNYPVHNYLWPGPILIQLNPFLLTTIMIYRVFHDFRA